MAQLLFYDDGHRYELDGEAIPSVSEILRFLSKEVYSDVNQYRMDAAADRGTRVHKQLELLDKLGECEADAETEPFIRAYIQFRKDHACEWTGIEKSCYNAELGFAGTMDRIGTMDGEPVILDIKAQSTTHAPLVKAQLNGYQLCQTEPHNLYCLQLMNTGKYRLYPVANDPTEFMACYTLHTALKKKRERGRIT